MSPAYSENVVEDEINNVFENDTDEPNEHGTAGRHLCKSLSMV